MFHFTAFTHAKCSVSHPIPSPSPPTHAHPRAVGVLSISLMFQTLKFMLFSGLTPQQGAPSQHHGSSPHGLSPPAAAIVSVPCREEGDGRRWPARLRAVSPVSCGCGDSPGGHGPAGPGQAWPGALHRAGMQLTTGPAHLVGPEGPQCPGAVPGSHPRAVGSWGQSGPEGPWGQPKLRVPGLHSET